MNLDEVLPRDILFKKIIEILLNHIIDKNKFKNMDSLFPLVQCFKITFCFFWFNVSRLFISLSHTQNSFHFHSPFSLYSFIYTCPQPFMPPHLKWSHTKNNITYLQPINNTYITPALSNHLILTCISRMWSKKGASIFYSVMELMFFYVKVIRCGFCKGCDQLWIFRYLRFWCEKVINVLCFRTKGKEKENF